MAMNKEAVRVAVEQVDGSNSFLGYHLEGAQPILRHLWENHVPWIVRKIVDFIGAIDDYLEEEKSRPVVDRGLPSDATPIDLSDG